MADSKNVFQSDSDVHISFEDQQKINTFAKYNNRNDEYRTEIKYKQNELSKIDDAEDELMLRSDEDEELPVAYRMGDNFFYMAGPKVLDSLKNARDKINREIKSRENESTTLQQNMSDLKTQLYAKFGSHINLEADE